MITCNTTILKPKDAEEQSLVSQFVQAAKPRKRLEKKDRKSLKADVPVESCTSYTSISVPVYKPSQWKAVDDGFRFGGGAGFESN